MSWKCSIHYWALGQLDFHVFVHALDPKRRRFYELGIGRTDWQLWPPRSVLDHRNEWTLLTDEELVRQIEWASGLLRGRAVE